MSGRCLRSVGFTLIELLVVLTIVALLLTLAAPRFFPNVNRAREVVLKQDLAAVRDALDKYYSDKGAYPKKLDDLVSERYLRKVPIDPITDSAATWIPVAPEHSEASEIFDIKSGAQGNARDGSSFRSW
jgi:general secretion pathway protein G